MPLRDEIRDYLAWVDGTSLHSLSYDERADSILALIDGQRCKWTQIEKGYPWYKTGCGKERNFNPNLFVTPHCPCCGHRIEVVEGEG